MFYIASQGITLFPQEAESSIRTLKVLYVSYLLPHLLSARS